MRRLTAPGSTPLLLVVLAALIAFTYINSFQASLTLDSKLIIGEDPRTKSWSTENLRHIFTENYWWPFAPGDLYRPLTTLSYLINNVVVPGGAGLAALHLVNLCLHVANAWLVFLLLQRLTTDRTLAWLAAAIFGVHPVNVEAVTNLVGRADLLAALSVVGAGFCYMRGTDPDAPNKRAWLAGAGVIAALGVFAKENAVMALALAMLHDLFWRYPALRSPHRGMSALPVLRQLASRWIAFVPALVLLFLVRFALGPRLIAPGHAFVDNPIYYAALLEAVLTALGIIGRYVGLLVLPRTLSCDYSYNQIPVFGEGVYWWHDSLAWFSAGLVIISLWLVVRWWRRRTLVAWAIAFFLTMLLPTSNVLIPIGSIMAERFLYLPSIGFCVVAGFALRRACAAMGEATSASSVVARLFGIVLSTALISALALRTYARNRDWRDEISIWQSAVVAVPNSFRAHFAYAEAIWQKDLNESALDRALKESEMALGIVERSAPPKAGRDQTVFLQLGIFHRFKGDFLIDRNSEGDARRHYANSIEFLERARDVDRIQKSTFREAVQRRSSATEKVPLGGNLKIYEELAICHMRLRQWQELATAARDIQRFAPSSAAGYAFQAVAAANLQHHQEAAIYFLAALILDTTDLEIRTNLARSYERLGVVPSPVSTDGQLRFDLASPMLRQHLNAAFGLVVRFHDAAGRSAEAALLREIGRQQFQIPLEEMMGPPR